MTRPTHVDVAMHHAAVQYLAKSANVRLLHLKGPASAAHFPNRGSSGTDADVLVHPEDFAAFVAALESRGWRTESALRGDVPHHAVVLRHDAWSTTLDLHRRISGIGVDAAPAFDVLWREHEILQLAHVGCPAPSRAGDALILLLHTVRSPHELRWSWDHEHLVEELTETERAQLEHLAGELVTTDELALVVDADERHRLLTPRQRLLHARMQGQGGTAARWAAMFVQEPSWRGRVSVARGALSSQRTHGRRPATRLARHLFSGARQLPELMRIVRTQSRP